MRQARWERVHSAEAQHRARDHNTRPDSPETLRRLAGLLDTRYELFGVRFGWDAIAGFIPVFGDLVTNVLSFYIVLSAAQLGAPGPVLARMLGNILIDNLLDAIPLLGNFADIVWRSNARNARLLDSWLRDPHRTARRSRWVVGLTLGFGLACVLAFASLAVTISVALLGWLLSPRAW